MCRRLFHCGWPRLWASPIDIITIFSLNFRVQEAHIESLRPNSVSLLCIYSVSFLCIYPAMLFSSAVLHVSMQQSQKWADGWVILLNGDEDPFPFKIVTFVGWFYLDEYSPVPFEKRKYILFHKTTNPLWYDGTYKLSWSQTPKYNSK